MICWQSYIPEIALKILDGRKIAPETGRRIVSIRIWVFDLDRYSGRYKFKQVPQKLLKGDNAAPIR